MGRDKLVPPLAFDRARADSFQAVMNEKERRDPPEQKRITVADSGTAIVV